MSLIFSAVMQTRLESVSRMRSHEPSFHRGGGRDITHSESGALIALVFLTRRMLIVELPNYKGQVNCEPFLRGRCFEAG